MNALANNGTLGVDRCCGSIHGTEVGLLLRPARDEFFCKSGTMTLKQAASDPSKKLAHHSIATNRNQCVDSVVNGACHFSWSNAGRRVFDWFGQEVNLCKRISIVPKDHEIRDLISSRVFSIQMGYGSPCLSFIRYHPTLQRLRRPRASFHSFCNVE